MKKILKYILIICSIVLTILLGINIYKNYSYKNNNNVIIEKTNNINTKIYENNTNKEKIEQEISTLKNNNKDKVWELEKWQKWNEEIKEMIN